MIQRYVWRDGKFRDKRTGKPMEVRDENAICRPAILPDIAAYQSVASNKLIDGRTDQREDLKRNGCRLADPSEFTVEGCRSEKWAKRLKMDVVDMSEKRLSDQL